MKELAAGYEFRVDQYEKQRWSEVMDHFQDANLYQTWAYDMVRYGRRGVCHLVLRKSGTLVAAAQARIVHLPGIKRGIAYIMWGPMWRRLGLPVDIEVFRQALRALRNEFSLRRGLVLRVYPLAFRLKDDILEHILVDEGFGFHDDGKNLRTLIIKLDPSLEEIRSGLDQKWRNCLNRAEKNSLEVIEGEEENLFDEIKTIYLEMANRKKLSEFSDIKHLKRVQRALPRGHKLKVVLCRLNGEICAGAIFSAMGVMAVYLVGATSSAGMKTNGSYFVQWSFIKLLKEKGFLYYDLNGINPETNPGTYHFKRGLAGRNGMDVEFLGKFQVADNPISSLVVNRGESFVFWYRKVLRKSRSLWKKNPHSGTRGSSRSSSG